MTTTQIIITVCSFSVSVAVGLIVYIWVDARRAIAKATTEDDCKERRERQKAELELVDKNLRNHVHDEHGGRATVEL